MKEKNNEQDKKREREIKGMDHVLMMDLGLENNDESHDCYDCGIYGCADSSENKKCSNWIPIPKKKSDQIKVGYEDSEKRIVGKEGGLKNDMDKLDWSLLPLDAAEWLVKVLQYGAKKYGRDNWKKVEWERNYAAMMRHWKKWKEDKEELDPESGLPHLAHAFTDHMFIVWKILCELKQKV